MKRFLATTAVAVLFVSLAATASRSGFAAGSAITSGPIDARVKALAAIQPGLGTVMTEYGNRFVDVYFAAHGGNWGLAQYQLIEMTEIQEVGETTRPEHAASLKAFEGAFLKPLAAAIGKKDTKGFDRRYRDTIEGCNGCHAATGHPFIHFRLPRRPVEDYLDFSLKTGPKPESK